MIVILYNCKNNVIQQISEKNIAGPRKCKTIKSAS